MFIDALFYQFCSFLCWNWGFSPFTHYIFLCPFFCFLKFISGTTWRSFLIFYQNLRGHLINKEAERVFEKNIFLGILGQKDPKWALREACQVWFSKKLNYRVFYSKKILFWFFQPIRAKMGSKNWPQKFFRLFEQNHIGLTIIMHLNYSFENNLAFRFLGQKRSDLGLKWGSSYMENYCTGLFLVLACKYSSMKTLNWLISIYFKLFQFLESNIAWNGPHIS